MYHTTEVKPSIIISTDEETGLTLQASIAAFDEVNRGEPNTLAREEILRRLLALIAVATIVIVTPTDPLEPVITDEHVDSGPLP